jgi:hypothetical protein
MDASAALASCRARARAFAGRKPERRPLFFPVRVLGVGQTLASSIPLRGAIIGDPLDEGDGDRAQEKNMNEAALAENQTEKPDEEEHERDYPDHLAVTCPRF